MQLRPAAPVHLARRPPAILAVGAHLKNAVAVSAGDEIIVSGEIAVHGIAIMSVRDGLEFETEIRSDTAALNGLVDMLAGDQLPRIC